MDHRTLLTAGTQTTEWFAAMLARKRSNSMLPRRRSGRSSLSNAQRGLQHPFARSDDAIHTEAPQAKLAVTVPYSRPASCGEVERSLFRQTSHESSRSTPAQSDQPRFEEESRNDKHALGMEDDRAVRTAPDDQDSWPHGADRISIVDVFFLARRLASVSLMMSISRRRIICGVAFTSIQKFIVCRTEPGRILWSRTST